MIIGICGWIGSGKDTVADYLVNYYGFQRESFAGTLKDAVSAVFGWDRNLLEGLTKEARDWREQVDPWWAARLGMPELTPRLILQQWGTEVCRLGFHDDIWVASLENKLQHTNQNIVISDCRFPNEITAIKNAGGKIIWVQRGPMPSWYDCAKLTVNTPEEDQWIIYDRKESMETRHPEVHASEWSWIGADFDAIVDNNGTLEQLYEKVKSLVPEVTPAKANEICRLLVGN